MARQGVRFVFFDLKGELEDDPQNPNQRATRDEFLKLTGAKYVRLIQESLPINPLLCDENANQNASVAYEVAALIRCFAPQLGAKQERAIAKAYQSLSEPDFAGLADELEGMDAQGVGAALIQKIVDFNLFASAQNVLCLRTENAKFSMSAPLIPSEIADKTKVLRASSGSSS